MSVIGRLSVIPETGLTIFDGSYNLRPGDDDGDRQKGCVMSENQASEWIGAREGAALLGISRASFYRLVTRGEIPAYRLGGSLRFKRQDVLAAIRPVPTPVAK